jgi:hypothetical protein
VKETQEVFEQHKGLKPEYKTDNEKNEAVKSKSNDKNN